MNRASWQNTEIKIGDTVKISYKIKEKGKERLQPYQGQVICFKGQAESRTMTVRKIASDGVGVERIFPLTSPWIGDLKVVGKPKRTIRRAKLYYLRELTGKKAKI